MFTYANELFENCSSGYLNNVKYIVEKEEICLQDINNCCSEACYKGHLEIVEYLIEKGAYHFNQFLLNAVLCKNPSIIRLVLNDKIAKSTLEASIE